MAENVEMIRPINLPEAQQLSENDVFILDSETGGVRKIPKNKVYTPVDDTLSESGEAADAKVTGEKIDELKAETALIQNPVGNKSGELVTFSDGADMPAISVIAHIVPKQSGTGTPSPENVRPISGWESVKTSVSGKNLFNNNADDYSRPVDYYICPIKLKVDTTYTVSIRLKSGGTAQSGFTVGIAKHGSRYQEFGSFVTIATASTQLPATIHFTTNSDYDDPKIILYTTPLSSQGVAYWLANYEVQLEEGTTATTYAPYNGHTTTTPLGRTVYGGTLDVVSGVLTDKMGVVDLGTLNWQYNGSSPYKWFYTSALASTIKPVATNLDKANILSPIYEVTTRAAVGADESKDYAIWLDRDKYIGVRDSRYTSAAAFKTAMSGVQLVYELATPTTYTLTPTEVSTLLGENNVWCDSGIVDVTYRKDINIVIDELTNAIVSLGSNV